MVHPCADWLSIYVFHSILRSLNFIQLSDFVQRFIIVIIIIIAYYFTRQHKTHTQTKYT